MHFVPFGRLIAIIAYVNPAKKYITCDIVASVTYINLFFVCSKKVKVLGSASFQWVFCGVSQAFN